MLKSVLAGVGVIAIIGASAAALHAGYYNDDDMRPRSLGVSAAGLDLTSPAGVDLLEQRVERAVRRVCDGDAQCRDDAWAGARPQIWAAIDRARERHGRWNFGRQPMARRWAPPPMPEAYDEREEEARAGYVSAPPPEPMPAAPMRGRAPVDMSGVLGSRIDGAIGQAFQSGETVRWRDGGWRGVVRVSRSRDLWPDICRTVTIVRATGGGWAPLREGEVCLGRDGRLHNGRRG